MNLTLETLCTIRVALCIARLEKPHDVRFHDAYREVWRQWAIQMNALRVESNQSHVDENTQMLHDARGGN